MSVTAEPRKRRQKYVRVNTRYEEFLAGNLTMDDLDEEEIARGQIRGADGTFKGRPPKWVPREFAIELQRRQMAMIKASMQGLLPKAFKTLDEMMDNPRPQPGDAAKVAAAKYVMDRNLGKMPDTVIMESAIDTPFEASHKRVVRKRYIPKEITDGEIVIEPDTE